MVLGIVLIQVIEQLWRTWARAQPSREKVIQQGGITMPAKKKAAKKAAPKKKKK